MKKNIVVFFCLSFLISCTKSGETYDFLTAEVTAQEEVTRTLTTPYSDKVFHKTGFLLPMLMEASDDGIFVLDVKDQATVVRYDWAFNLAGRIGRGRGSGPGEIGGAADFHLSADTLYITDGINGLIHQYTIANEFVKSIPVEEEIPNQITTAGDHLAVSISSSGRFLLMNERGELSGRSEPITDDEQVYRQILQSRLFSDDEHIYRLPFLLGLLIRYDRTGNLQSVTRMIDHTDPSFADRGAGRDPNGTISVRKEDSDILTLGASLYGGTLCVLRFNHLEDSRIIDCYRTTDSRYQFSFIPPEDTRDFEIHGDYFAAIHDSSLTVWEWQSPGSR